MTPDQWATFGASVVVVVGALVAWFRWILPRYRKVTTKATAAVDSLVGREAIRDSITGEIVRPALPGIGVRMANVEDAITMLVTNQKRLDEHDQRFEGHDQRIKKLEDGAVERIVGKAESAAAFRAIEAVAKQDTPEDPA